MTNDLGYTPDPEVGPEIADGAHDGAAGVEHCETGDYNTFHEAACSPEVSSPEEPVDEAPEEEVTTQIDGEGYDHYLFDVTYHCGCTKPVQVSLAWGYTDTDVNECFAEIAERSCDECLS